MSNSDLAIKNKSPGFLENFLFNNRFLVLLVFAIITVVLGFQATKLKPDASFEKMIPQSHPFIANMMAHADKLDNSANSIQVAVSTKEGDIFTKEFLEALQLITEDLVYLPGVDRQGLKSLWTPNVRWLAVTELGFDGGPMIPPTYNGSQASIDELRKNVMASDQVGRLVANNFKSTIIHVPLFDRDPITGEALNYQTFSNNIEEIRSKYQNGNVDVHIIGFAKKVGDLLDGYWRHWSLCGRGATRNGSHVICLYPLFELNPRPTCLFNYRGNLATRIINLLRLRFKCLLCTGTVPCLCDRCQSRCANHQRHRSGQNNVQ